MFKKGDPFDTGSPRKTLNHYFFQIITGTLRRELKSKGAIMQTKKRKIAIFIASILLTVFGRSSLSLSFSVSPSKISSSYTTQSFLLPDIKVTNNDTESIDVSVSVLPLGQDS
ncbi:MAG: hypothetical protein ACPL6C_03395, partial [bacterium]